MIFLNMQEKTNIEIINQIFEMDKKSKNNGLDKFQRNIERLNFLLEAEGYSYHNPIGEKYNETRTDCQATIINDAVELIISDVIKPIIYFKDSQGITTIIQQARVII